MPFKSKRQKGARNIYEDTRDNRDTRRTRLKESIDAEHLHMKLLEAGERIEELRAALEKQIVDEKATRSLLSVAESELARVVDSAGGPVRRLRQKISRLNIRIRQLSGDVVMCTTDDDNDASSHEYFSSDDDEERVVRRRPKIGSYKKKAGLAVADQAAIDKYKHRKLVEFEDVVDKLFNNVLRMPVNGEGDSPGTVASLERGEDAFQWVLSRLLSKKPKVWAHLLREKRTIQEAEEAAMATIRKHWLDKGLGLFLAAT
jgi:hypothetical protein